MNDFTNIVRSERKKAVLRILAAADFPMTCEEIANQMETSPSVVSDVLRKLSCDDNLVHKVGRVKKENKSVVSIWKIGGGEREDTIDKKELAMFDEKARSAIKRGVAVLVIGGKKIYDRGAVI